MDKIRRIADHRSIDALQSPLLVVSPSLGALRLMEAAREPLQPDVTGAGHFLVAAVMVVAAGANAAGPVLVFERFQCWAN